MAETNCYKEQGLEDLQSPNSPTNSKSSVVSVDSENGVRCSTPHSVYSVDAVVMSPSLPTAQSRTRTLRDPYSAVVALRRLPTSYVDLLLKKMLMKNGSSVLCHDKVAKDEACVAILQESQETEPDEAGGSLENPVVGRRRSSRTLSTSSSWSDFSESSGHCVSICSVDTVVLSPPRPTVTVHTNVLRSPFPIVLLQRLQSPFTKPTPPGNGAEEEGGNKICMSEKEPQQFVICNGDGEEGSIEMDVPENESHQSLNCNNGNGSEEEEEEGNQLDVVVIEPHQFTNGNGTEEEGSSEIDMFENEPHQSLNCNVNASEEEEEEDGNKSCMSENESNQSLNCTGKASKEEGGGQVLEQLQEIERNGSVDESSEGSFQPQQKRRRYELDSDEEESVTEIRRKLQDIDDENQGSSVGTSSIEETPIEELSFHSICEDDLQYEVSDKLSQESEGTGLDSVQTGTFSDDPLLGLDVYAAKEDVQPNTPNGLHSEEPEALQMKISTREIGVQVSLPCVDCEERAMNPYSKVPSPKPIENLFPF